MAWMRHGGERDILSEPVSEAPQMISNLPPFFDLHRHSLSRGNLLVLLSLLAAVVLSDFPHNRPTMLLLLPALSAMVGTGETVRLHAAALGFLPCRRDSLHLYGPDGAGRHSVSADLSVLAFHGRRQLGVGSALAGVYSAKFFPELDIRDQEKQMIKGFRDFLMRGNVVDLAVAVIIGAAFTAIVTSFVTNIVTPADRGDCGQARLFRPGAEGQRRRHYLRNVFECRDLIPADRRSSVFHDRRADELCHVADAEAGRRRGEHQDLPAVPVGDSTGRHALQVLYPGRLDTADTDVRLVLQAYPSDTPGVLFSIVTSPSPVQEGLMKRFAAVALLPFVSLINAAAQQDPTAVFGYRHFTQQAKWDQAFMAVPDAALAGQHLKELTKAPHWASSPEDYQTALYVAEKFRAAGARNHHHRVQGAAQQAGQDRDRDLCQRWLQADERANQRARRLDRRWRRSVSGRSAHPAGFQRLISLGRRHRRGGLRKLRQPGGFPAAGPRWA